LGIGHAHLSDWLVKKDSILSFLSLPFQYLRTSYLNPPIKLNLYEFKHHRLFRFHARQWQANRL
jgi:hypothetical protein